MSVQYLAINNKGSFGEVKFRWLLGKRVCMGATQPTTKLEQISNRLLKQILNLFQKSLDKKIRNDRRAKFFFCLSEDVLNNQEEDIQRSLRFIN